MSIHEQETLKEKYYSEAIRYMENAKECLKKANKVENRYKDKKYVRMACGTAYSGMLIALEGFLLLKGVYKPSKKERKSIEYFQNNLGKLDKKMLDYLNDTYNILHLSGYYDGIQDAIVVKRGFDLANTLIDKIRPL